MHGDTTWNYRWRRILWVFLNYQEFATENYLFGICYKKNAKANFGDNFVCSCFNRKSNNLQKIKISIKHQQSRCRTHTNRVNQLAIHCFISKLIQFTLERFLHRHCERLEKGFQTKVLNLAPVNAFNTKRHPIKTGSYETLQLFFSIEACTWTCHPLLWPTSCRL